MLFRGVVSLLAAAVLAWTVRPVPPPHPFYLPALLMTAARIILFASLAAIAAVMIAFRETPQRERFLLTRRTVLAAVWFVPIVVFLFQRSPLAAVSTAFLVAAVTVLLLTPQSEATNQFLPVALCAALSLQGAAVAIVADHQLIASFLAGIATFLVISRLDTNTGEPSRFSRSKTGLMASVILAFLFTSAGLMRYLTMYPRSGSEDASTPPAATAHGEELGAYVGGGAFSGVIIWPEIKQHVTLVPPVPAALRGVARVNTKPLSIPFDGVYWLLRTPDRLPPRNAYIAHGSPAELGFRSTDHHWLTMQARQNLGQLVDLACCSRIEIAIRNADRYPGSVSLELILFNTTVAGRPSESLGKAAVKSTPWWRPGSTAPPAEETLTFSIPPSTSIRQFDELATQFHLTRMRSDRAPRIGIESFTLVPRGL